MIRSLLYLIIGMMPSPFFGIKIVMFANKLDNTDQIYDITKLHKMYDYLTSHGSCFYIQYEGVLVGDVTLQDNSELSIVISKEYQNLQIGRRCISEMIQMAKRKKMVRVTAQIYPFNTQSQRMFWLWDFRKVDEEWV